MQLWVELLEVLQGAVAAEKEREKIAQRLPAAIKFIREQGLNEHFPGRYESLGIITCGGSYNTVIRALQRQGLADVYGNAEVPIYCMNVAYPLVPDELIEFCVGKEQVLVLEEVMMNVNKH